MGLETGTNTTAAGHQHHKSPPPESNNHHHHQTPKLVIIFAMVAFSCLFLYHSSLPLRFPGIIGHRNSRSAAINNNTIVITAINDAWAEPNSMFDLLLESFQIGNQTQRFLNHLVVIALDQKAYARCLKLHPHCYNLNTDGVDFSEEAYFMAADYLKMMWRRIDFLHIMWFRDPFPHFHEDGDFQIACDYFRGNPFDLNNLPNGGFTYVKSNVRTIQFYKYWFDSRLNYTGLHDQDVFNKIKFDPFISHIRIRIRFLDTSFFGGFCEPSRDFDKVCTMHANCCVGLENKVHDIGIMLQDWRKYMLSLGNETATLSSASWTVPQSCRGSFQRPRAPKKRGNKR
ncbi:Nucleotide-diphospho-sugar transferase [Cynara cardunculus var. scolymus]|uniref:Nucleotide-diphospho-sugar transferase n=1 Tax=Cynara cardunculus var. scolymus TaxID=59895 RepID=A0A103XRJ8_CYNCS|nr:Nucleotide-diphospho-sugar transferase [Cynara cardunculus var. scolymus]